jgi:phage/plasmid-like protein (TIGR03299 family)
MPHEFTSGVFTKNQTAWHGLGIVLPGPCSAREGFQLAQADWTVISQPVHDPDMNPWEGYQGLHRSDNGARLIIQPDSYKVIQNSELLKVAEAFEAHASLSAVVVLRGGLRVSFTMEITDACADILPGDTVRSYLVGATGHDGKLAFQILFSPVRVVCQNTLSQAIGIAANGEQAHRVKIRHTLNADQLIKNIPQLIDIQRRQFSGGVEELKAMAAQPCRMAEFRAYVSTVFQDQLSGTINAERGNPASARPKILEDLPQWEILNRKFHGAAIGASIPGVQGTVWAAYNAITEFLTHDAGKAKDPNKAAAARLEALYWGDSADRLTIAHRAALAATLA